MRKKSQSHGPTFDVEAQAMAAGDRPVAGVDEAGRGPWAGPVVAAAVILDPGRIPPGLDDSKKLDASAREAAFDRITATAHAIGVGIVDVAQIDQMNILAATLWAMAQAVQTLHTPPRLVLIDGNRAPALPCASRTLVRGDALCLSIAAASIIAKVTRDRIMVALGPAYSDYGFERHKGYGTPEHQAVLARLGPTPHHRRSFAPVRRHLR